MVNSVSTKDFKLSDKSLRNLQEHIQKTENLLPGFDVDGIKMDMVIEKHTRRRGNQIRLEEDGSEEKAIREELPKSPMPLYYDFSLRLNLPRKTLTVHTTGNDADHAVNIGFEKLLKEIKKYKEKHFPSNSRYPDRNTIKSSARVWRSY